MVPIRFFLYSPRRAEISIKVHYISIKCDYLTQCNMSDSVITCGAAAAQLLLNIPLLNKPSYIHTSAPPVCCLWLRCCISPRRYGEDLEDWAADNAASVPGPRTRPDSLRPAQKSHMRPAGPSANEQSRLSSFILLNRIEHTGRHTFGWKKMNGKEKSRMIFIPQKTDTLNSSLASDQSNQPHKLLRHAMQTSSETLT